MANLLYEPPVEGFGYGPQGEVVFSSRPDYNQIPYPDDEYSEDSEEEADPYAAIYAAMDLQSVYGKQIVIWTHRNPETLALFTPVQGDSFFEIVRFARSTVQFNSAVDKMMLLLPGYKRPLAMDTIYNIKPGACVLITPLYDYVISIEVKQLGHKIDMVVSVDMTVLELKGRLQTERGYPAQQTELLYKDEAMENSRYLFEYDLAHSSTVFVLLSLKQDTLVHVDTFWGKRYHLYVDPCTTGLEIIASILRRTVSQSVSDVVRLFELFLPKHTLVLYLGHRLVDWDNCLGLYGIESGNILRLTTIGLAHEMSLQRVPVKILDTGKQHRVQVSKFDRWSAVVLKLHGMTGYPVNLMRLVRHNNSTVDFSDSVGAIQPQTKAVKLDTLAVMSDNDLVYGLTLKFRVADGINELLKVSPSRTIKSVKDTLESVGVPNASVSDLLYNGHRLPNNKRVVDVIEEYKVPIELSLRQFPVFIHGANNVIYRMLANSKESLATFFVRVAMKANLQLKDHLLLSCGMALRQDASAPVYRSRILPGSSIFLIPRQRFKAFLIINGDWLTKLKIPTQASPKDIKDLLWKQRNVPEGGLASIGNFLQWFFDPQVRDSKFNEQASPSKEKMLVFEQQMGDMVMQMRTEEPTHAGKFNGAGNKLRRKDKFDTTLEELEHCAERYRRKELKQLMKLPGIPRHMSAAEPGRHGRHHQVRRKAFTTEPAGYNKLPAIPVPYVGGKVNRKWYVQRRGQHTEAEDENGDNDWVFSLTHELVEKPTRDKRRRHARK